MNGIKFGQQREKIDVLLKDWQVRVDEKDMDGDLKDMFRAAASGAFDRLETDAKYRVSLLGEFSAGKSSLIMALTGAQVATGAGVTTKEAQTFEWKGKGVTFVDTPGVQAEASETDHDEIARKSTLDADLILFVLTNELFNQRLADYFHFVAGPDDLGLADKMLVIVNKMDREDNEDEVIISEVENAIKPLSPSVHLAAVDLYLKSQKVDGNTRERFVDLSRIRELVAAIDGFIEERGEMGRLTRPLQLFEEDLEKERDRLLGDSGDNGNARQELELNRRQKRMVDEAGQSLTSLEMQWAMELRRIVLSRTTETLDAVQSVKTEEELKELFQNAVHATDPEIDTYFVKIADDLQNWVRELQEKIEELDMSELGKKIRSLRAEAGVSVKFDGLPTRGFDFVAGGRKILDQGIRPLLDNASKNPNEVKNLVKNLAKISGKKFKPWGATNLSREGAKWAGRGGKALGPLMVAVDFYIEYRNERAHDERERHLAKTRLSMQREFLKSADDQVKTLRTALSGIRMDTIHEMSRRLEEQAAAITADEAKEKDTADLASEFIRRSRSLRNEISTVVG